MFSHAVFSHAVFSHAVCIRSCSCHT
ncbi:TPA: hypothetical protein ACKRTO_003697 [Providencia rettgeri]